MTFILDPDTNQFINLYKVTLIKPKKDDAENATTICFADGSFTTVPYRFMDVVESIDTRPFTIEHNRKGESNG